MVRLAAKRRHDVAMGESPWLGKRNGVTSPDPSDERHKNSLMFSRVNPKVLTGQANPSTQELQKLAACGFAPVQ